MSERACRSPVIVVPSDPSIYRPWRDCSVDWSPLRGNHPPAAPLFATETERFLQEEGFTDIQLTTSGGVAGLAGLVDGKADLAAMFIPTFAAAVDAGSPIVCIGGLHYGCAEIWAPQGVNTLKDLRGRTVVVRSKAPADLAYSFMAIGPRTPGSSRAR